MTNANDAERALAQRLIGQIVNHVECDAKCDGIAVDGKAIDLIELGLASAHLEGYRQGQEEMQAALEAADYYINRLEAAALRKVVRDMTEAMEGYRTARARTRALPITGDDNAK